MGVNKQLQGSIWMIERMLAALIVIENNDSSVPCLGLLMFKIEAYRSHRFLHFKLHK